jgi:hypothetical protein
MPCPGGIALSSRSGATFAFATIVLVLAVPMGALAYDGPSRQDVADWTIMVYIDADNDLEPNMFEDFAEMEKVRSTDEIKIVVLADTYEAYEGTHWYFIEEGETDIDLSSGIHDCDCEDIAGECPGELNMGDAATLEYFVVSAARFAPAENYMLVLWDHGASWYGVCWDWSSPDDSPLPEGDYDCLSMTEISDALSRACGTFEHGEMKIIVFDACLMAAVEVAYEIRDLAEYMVGAITTVARQGFEWESLLTRLNALEDATPYAVGRTMVDVFMEYYSECAGSGIGGYPYASESLIDLSMMSRLVDNGVSRLAEALLAYAEEGGGKSTIQYCSEVHTPQIQYLGELDPFVDLGIFAETLAENIPELQTISADILSLLKDTVVHYGFVTSEYGGCMNTTGMSIYYTCATGHLYDYGDLRFGVDTLWDEFLFALSESPHEDPSRPVA